jgi:hypothetical protein
MWAPSRLASAWRRASSATTRRAPKQGVRSGVNAGQLCLSRCERTPSVAWRSAIPRQLGGVIADAFGSGVLIQTAAALLLVVSAVSRPDFFSITVTIIASKQDP